MTQNAASVKSADIEWLQYILLMGEYVNGALNCNSNIVLLQIDYVFLLVLRPQRSWKELLQVYSLESVEERALL